MTSCARWELAILSPPVTYLFTGHSKTVINLHVNSVYLSIVCVTIVLINTLLGKSQLSCSSSCVVLHFRLCYIFVMFCAVHSVPPCAWVGISVKFNCIIQCVCVFYSLISFENVKQSFTDIVFLIVSKTTAYVP